MQLNRWQLIQATPSILRRPLDFLTRYNTAGPLVTIDGGDFQIVLVNDPDAIEHVLLHNHRNYSKRTPQFETFSLVAGNGLLSSDGDFWLQQRRLAQPAFHRRQLLQWQSWMVAAAQERAELWQARMQPRLHVDMEHEMHTLSLRIVCRVLFGVDVRHETEYLLHAVTDALNHVVMRGQYPLPGIEQLPLAVNRRYRRARAELTRWTQRLLAERRAGDAQDDLLQMWLDGDLSEEQIQDEILTFIIAGYETVATSMTWLWYLLSQNRTALAQIVAQLDSTLGDRPPTTDDFQQLPLLNAAIDEGLRMYPPAWVISRRAIEADVILQTPIAAASYIVISPYAVHRNPQFWPQPERFSPQRFLDASERHRYAYIPFGGGPRLCIGNRFAEMEMMLVMATLLQRFDCRYVADQPPIPQPLVTVRPKQGLPMEIIPWTAQS